MKNQKILSGEDLQYAEELRQKIIDISNKIYNETGVMPLVKGITDVNRELPKTNLHLSSILKKIGRWGVALFGIRSIYGLISSTASKIGQENEEIGAKLQAIKGSITNLLAPVVEVIVNLVYRLLSYLNVITKTFLGIDLFAKSAKSAKSTVGSAQKLRKTLAGFDEMNILNDNVSGGGGGGSNLSAPELPEIDTSKWEKTIENWVKDYKEIMKISRKEAKETFLGANGMSGYFELGLFDIEQGLLKMYTSVGVTYEGISKIIEGYNTKDTKLTEKGWKETLDGIKQHYIGMGQTILGIHELVFGSGAKLGTKLRQVFEGVGIDVGKVANFIYKSFFSTFTDVGFSVGNWVGGNLKTIVNSILSYINKKINNYIDNLNSAINVINKLGLNVKKIPHITLPKLAKGGIVNMPSKGVPVGSAITGESGAEGVIPLTDSQQMALLGEAIGKYITINANIVNTMNGRVISRELQKIQQESSFASNR